MAWFTVSYSKYSSTPFIFSIKLHPFQHIDGMCVYRNSLHIPKSSTEQRAFSDLLLLLLSSLVVVIATAEYVMGRSSCCPIA